jgi:hypothetical protein
MFSAGSAGQIYHQTPIHREVIAMTASRRDATLSVRSGRSVQESPHPTITEKVRANTTEGTREVHRSVTTGRFVKQTQRA